MELANALVYARDADDNLYGYVPTAWICDTYLVIFSVATCIHLFLSLRYRMWWLLYTICFCGMIELIGWAGRYWSSQNPTNLTPYEIQIITLIIAPTPLVAANFIILGRIINFIGIQYSRLSPRQYTIVFCTADVVALIVQFTGGGMAAIAAGNDQNPDLGGHIMLVGIVFQMVAIMVFTACACEIFYRFIVNKPLQKYRSMQDDQWTNNRSPLEGKLKLLACALMFSTLCLFIRSIYRTIELADGWDGTVIATQWLFDTFDGAMVVLAMYTFIFAHPGRLLPKSESAKSDHVSQTIPLYNAASNTTAADLEVQRKTISSVGSGV